MPEKLVVPSALPSHRKFQIAKLRGCENSGAKSAPSPGRNRYSQGPQNPEDWCWSISLTCEALRKAIQDQAGIFLVVSEARTVFADRLAMTLRASGCIVAFDRCTASLTVRGRFPPERLKSTIGAGTRTAWLRRLETALDRQPSATPVIIFDTADLLGHSAICELVSILNGSGAGAKIRIVLIGRPELRGRFGQSALALVNDHLQFCRQLQPLDEADIRSFIAHRMPHDFAIGTIATENLISIGNYIRNEPKKASELWARARRLARDTGETTPTLTHAAKAAQMLFDNPIESQQRKGPSALSIMTTLPQNKSDKLGTREPVHRGWWHRLWVPE